MPGHVPVHALSMCRAIMVDRTYQRQMLYLLGEMRKVLTDLNTRDGGGDRLKQSPNIVRSIWFKIPGVEVADSAPAKKNND